LNTFSLISTSSIILGFSFVLRFALTLALARFLLPEQLGIYSWSVTAFGIAGILVNLGLDFFLIRKIPEYRNNSQGLVSSVINHTKRQVRINTFLIILLIFPLSYLAVSLFDSASAYYLELMIILCALPFAAYSLIFSSTLRSFDFPLSGQFIDSILQTGILLLLVILLFTLFNNLFSNDEITLLLVSFFVISWFVSYLIASLIFKKNIKVKKPQKTTKEKRKEWRSDSLTIMIGILGWSLLGRSDVLFLGFLVQPSEVGAYFICLRLGETALFFSSISYYIWAGEISNLIQKGKIEEAQLVLKKSSKLCFISTFIFFFIGMGLAEEILLFINETYIQYVFIFKIALFSFFLLGSVGMLNPMYYIIGQQEFLAKLQWAVGLLFLFLIFVSVPIYGITGCVISFAFCQLIYVSVLAIRLKIKHDFSILPI